MKEKKLENKTCRCCKKTFFRKSIPYRIANKDWQKRLFCSKRCQTKIINKGRVFSKVHLERLRSSHLGNEPWNKGKNGCFSKDALEKKSKAMTGKTWSLKLESRFNLSNSKKGYKNPMWKDGATRKNSLIRGSLEYRLWREAVFERDDWTCQHCNVRGKTLNADHIKPFSLYPRLRFSLSNGRTLCVDCHRKTSTYGSNLLTKKIVYG